MCIPSPQLVGHRTGETDTRGHKQGWTIRDREEINSIALLGAHRSGNPGLEGRSPTGFSDLPGGPAAFLRGGTDNPRTGCGLLCIKSFISFHSPTV